MVIAWPLLFLHYPRFLDTVIINLRFPLARFVQYLIVSVSSTSTQVELKLI